MLLRIAVRDCHEQVPAGICEFRGRELCLTVFAVPELRLFPAYPSKRPDDAEAGVILRSEISERKSRPQRSVRPVLLSALQPELRSVIDRWYAGQGIKEHMHGQVMPFIVKLGHDALDIMVVDEIIKAHAVSEAHVPLAAYGMRDLKIVVIVVSAVQSLVKSVVRDGMQHALIDPAVVFSVYDLAHQPEVLLKAAGKAAQFTHEVLIKHVRGVESQSIDVEFGYPGPHGIEVIVPHFRFIHVQLRQKVMPAPVVVRESVVIAVVAPEV